MLTVDATHMCGIVSYLRATLREDNTGVIEGHFWSNTHHELTTPAVTIPEVRAFGRVVIPAMHTPAQKVTAYGGVAPQDRCNGYGEGFLRTEFKLPIEFNGVTWKLSPGWEHTLRQKIFTPGTAKINPNEIFDTFIASELNEVQL